VSRARREGRSPDWRARATIRATIGIAQQRLGQAHEARQAWAQAAQAHEQAGRTAGYPLRHWALVDAARCYAAAGEPERALALYEEVEREAPDLNLPDHLRAQFRELRAVAQR
jgi:tetratricopeptide (TPR) repeat protein